MEEKEKRTEQEGVPPFEETGKDTMAQVESGAETMAEGAGVSQAPETGMGQEPEAEADKAETETNEEPEAGTGEKLEAEIGQVPAVAQAGETPRPEKSKQSGLRGLIGGMVALAAVAVGLLASGVLDDTHYKPIAYAKDNALYISDVRHDPYMAYDNLSSGGDFGYAYLAWGVSVSDDNQSILFQGDVDGTYGYQLYARDTDPKGAESRVMAADAALYQADASGQNVAFLTEEGELYYAGDGDAVLVAEGLDVDSEAFWMDRNGKTIAYRLLGDSAYQIMRYNVETGESTLITDTTQSYLFYDDGIYYMEYNEDGSLRLYDLKNGAEEPILVCDGAQSVAVNEDRSQILYLTVGEPIPYSRLVEDDCLESDQALTEPVEGDYADEEAYQNAVTAYEAKENRDAIRALMADGTGADLISCCYWYVNGQSTLLSERVINAAFAGGGVAFLAAPETTTPVLLSEASTENAIWQAYYMDLSEKAETWMAAAGQEPWQVTGAAVAGFENIGATADMNTWLYVSTGEDGAYQIVVDSQNGEAVQLPEDVAQVEFSPVGHAMAYFTEYSETEGNGSLWYFKDGESVLLSEAGEGYFFENDGDGLFFMTKDEGGNTHLHYYDGKQVTDIAAGVYYAQSYDNGVMAYLTDYDTENGVGNLYLWKDGKASLLDSGVSHMFLYD